MWFTYVVVSFLTLRVNCEISVLSDPKDPKTLICLKNIILKYFAQNKKVVYVNLDFDADDLLKTIHKLEAISVNTRSPPAQVSRANLAYIIVARDVAEFATNIMYLNKEPNWNPYARFLAVIKFLEKYELRQVFDSYLVLHVKNAVVINGITTEMYTYNPYDDYACGKYYNEVIELGKCLEVTEDIYPEKVKTGLRNCFFNVSVPHWPPFGIDPAKVTDRKYPVGAEQHIFDIISKIEHFEYKFNYDYDPEMFSLVTSNMSVSGPMLSLANNKTDVMLGGLFLVPSRARMFFYLCGHLDLVDEIRIMVKRAVERPAWKNFYLEFSPTVWALMLLAFVIYSALVVILLKAEDKSYIVLILLDNLLSHGSKFRCRQTVSCVFILWVWFAFLVNCYYTTTLMSLTTKPSMNYQIQSEQDVAEHDLEPCISSVMEKFIKAESDFDHSPKFPNSGTKSCSNFLDSIKSISESYRLYTVVAYSVYTFNKQQFYDEYGRSPVYSFSRPYAKAMYAMYFKNGFPMYERLHMLTLRIRETGLADKSLDDHYYDQKIKYHFRSESFVTRFAIPWYPYFIGLSISCITFALEIASQNKTIPNMAKWA